MPFPPPLDGTGFDAMRATAEGLAGIAVSAEYADGVIDVAENAHVEHHLAHLHVFRALLPGEMEDILSGMHEIVHEVPSPVLLAVCALVIPRRLKATAFFLAADVVLADGHVSDAEYAFLDNARRALDVDDETARTVLDALAIKHRE